MNPEVLILSGLYDFSSDLVALELERARVPYARLNREHLPDNRITLDPIAPTLSVDGPGGSWVAGPELRSIYFRQPIFLRNTPSLPLDVQEQLQRSQWHAFLRGLSVFRGAAWMNDPPATYLAESKPYQLAQAAACGFQVPATIATNDAQGIRDRFAGDVVIKSLDTVLLHDGEDCLFTYTTVTRSEPLATDALAAAPLLAQHALSPKTDIRVTLIGDRLFAVRIMAGGSGIAGDWRLAPRDTLEYRDVTLDDETANSCRRLVARLGLAFAAIDLLETPEGIMFIEVNPTGEWGWLSNPGRRIDAAVAGWLADPPYGGL